ncbi:MAG TPA: hypothetical protein DCE42_01435 [Myxococcales bacterium]|nr:hypothetical protein [Deltaproteobacteria bacterium]HAA53385.1 hypothetical protein [Myxococcales bacterium]|tara:strand:+ start:23898 stop:24155 length:258 start_codon:yes stop_codon:yes gene_type:complete
MFVADVDRLFVYNLLDKGMIDMDNKQKETYAWYIIGGCVLVIVLALVISRFTHKKEHHPPKKRHASHVLIQSPQQSPLFSYSRHS